MKPELDKQLCDKYPLIFKNRNKSMQESCMAWGFSHGDGWYDVIDALCEAATYIYTTSVEVDIEDGKRLGLAPLKFGDGTESYYYIVPAPVMVADQVKEKFGTLRFYYHLEFSDMVEELLQSKKYPELQKVVDDYVHFFDGLVHFAETLSGRTCEETGKRGEMHASPSGWMRTLNVEYGKENGYNTTKQISQ